MPFFLTNFISALFFAQTALFFAQIFLQSGVIQYNFAGNNHQFKYWNDKIYNL